MKRSRRQVLTITTALFGVVSLSPLTPVSAFDPNAGKYPQPAAYSPGLPDPSVLYETHTYRPPPVAPPIEMPGAQPPIAAQPVAAIAPAAGAAPGYISPALPPPPAPLYPQRGAQAAPMTATPVYPPVSPDVAAKAQAMMGQPQPTGVLPSIEIPPSAPVVAGVVPPMPPPGAVVDAAAPITPVQPTSKLSDQTREILSSIPSSINANKPTKKGVDVKVDRVSPEIEAVLGPGAKEDQFESVGLSIKVRRPGLDANYELNRAYTALMGGDSQQAIDIYKDILSTDPKNQDALFGLAATYHRQGNIEKARPLYGMLLKVNPNHREGLNNFLVLVGDESPQDAMPELERLEERNPDFSPIPAQSAVVLDKLGYHDLARDKMLRAIDLAPDNLTYKYNLAVMLDHQGRGSDAAALYKSLIEASLRGEKVPATVEVMQKRLNYLTTVATIAKAAGG